MLLFLSLLLVLSRPLTASFIIDSYFKLDVHSHVVTDTYREALIAAGYPVIHGTLYTDGLPVPTWNLSSHIASMDTL
jgi:hypothetical protein